MMLVIVFRYEQGNFVLLSWNNTSTYYEYFVFMNKSIQVLFDEHEVIANAIDAAKHARALIEKSEKQYETTIRDLIKFFRNYCDNFHHQKEEAVLFPEMKKKNELLADGILKEMFDNHEDFREMLKEIEKSINEKKYLLTQQKLEVYCESLLNHIAVENDEVFQIAETLFSEDELEKIMNQFDDCDIETGIMEKQELAELAEAIRQNLDYAG